VCERSESRWEDLRWVAVSCCVRTKVEEELKEREVYDECYRAQGAELAREDPQKEGGHQESLDLNEFAAKILDSEDGDVVPRYEPKDGDDDVPDRNLE